MRRGILSPMTPKFAPPIATSLALLPKSRKMLKLSEESTGSSSALAEEVPGEHTYFVTPNVKEGLAHKLLRYVPI